eukprot:758068-Hanusia_phi.AAC.1
MIEKDNRIFSFIKLALKVHGGRSLLRGRIMAVGWDGRAAFAKLGWSIAVSLSRFFSRCPTPGRRGTIG